MGRSFDAILAFIATKFGTGESKHSMSDRDRVRRYIDQKEHNRHTLSGKQGRDDFVDNVVERVESPDAKGLIQSHGGKRLFVLREIHFPLSELCKAIQYHIPHVKYRALVNKTNRHKSKSSYDVPLEASVRKPRHENLREKVAHSLNGSGRKGFGSEGFIFVELQVLLKDTFRATCQSISSGSFGWKRSRHTDGRLREGRDLQRTMSWDMRESDTVLDKSRNAGAEEAQEDEVNSRYGFHFDLGSRDHLCFVRQTNGGTLGDPSARFPSAVELVFRYFHRDRS